MPARSEPNPRRRVRWAITVALLGAVAVWPLIRRGDDVPLSSYPMYAEPRGREVVFATAAGLDGDGTRRRLSLATIAATDDPLIALATVRDAIARGQAPALCAGIAARVDASMTQVEIVEERHDVVALAEGRPSLIDRTVEATCSVTR